MDSNNDSKIHFKFEGLGLPFFGDKNNSSIDLFKAAFNPVYDGEKIHLGDSFYGWSSYVHYDDLSFLRITKLSNASNSKDISDSINSLKRFDGLEFKENPDTRLILANNYERSADDFNAINQSVIFAYFANSKYLSGIAANRNHWASSPYSHMAKEVKNSHNLLALESVKDFRKTIGGDTRFYLSPAKGMFKDTRNHLRFRRVMKQFNVSKEDRKLTAEAYSLLS